MPFRRLPRLLANRGRRENHGGTSPASRVLWTCNTTARHNTAGHILRFENGQSERVEGLLLMPAVLGAIDANEKHAVGNVIVSIGSGCS